MDFEHFPSSRSAALARLRDFLPKAGREYAAQRNYDVPRHDNVSRLSPYLRHRAVTEEEVLAATLQRWSLSSSEKFVQEVVWRGYFRGWLERRPSVWDNYKHGVLAAWDRVQSESGLRNAWEDACRGATGIACFDHWAQEIVKTGYLHNHARMWFASIWIFTLRLPWELGADFFLRHLLDGDAASNTLGWRWVAGLHTTGKHYVARPSNIEKYTQGRFNPDGLALSPDPLIGLPHPEPIGLRSTRTARSDLRTGLLMTEDDLSPGFAIRGREILGTYFVNGASGRSPLAVSEGVKGFTLAMIDDALERHSSALGPVSQVNGQSGDVDLLSWARTHNLEQVVVPYLQVGPARDAIGAELERLAKANVSVVEVRRHYDDLVWPHATAGFFKVRKRIPSVLKDLGL